jgi:HEPN domain-containing protein
MMTAGEMPDTFRPFLTIDGSKRGITIGGLIDEQSPFGQWRLSHQYCQAARILATAAKEAFSDAPETEEVGDVLLPTHLMMCHSVELALKAFLLTKGSTPKQLRTPPLNHDLMRLLELATAADLDVEPTVVQTIRSLASAATDFYFRYGSEEAGSIERAVDVFVPPIENSMSAIESIGSAVFIAVRATLKPPSSPAPA